MLEDKDIDLPLLDNATRILNTQEAKLFQGETFTEQFSGVGVPTKCRCIGAMWFLTILSTISDQTKSRSRGDALERERQAQLSRAIGARLKALYGQTVREEVPARFVELLAKLDE